MADTTEKLDDALIEDMGKGYRFRPLMQAMIIAVVFFILAFIAWFLGFLDFAKVGNLTIVTLGFCWLLAFLFPLIVKTRTHRVSQISMGLFWAAIFSLITAILLLIIDDTGIDIQTSSIPLLIAFLVGVASQLFQHLNPELVKRSALTYLSIFACAVVFFICVWIYMESIIPSWGIWLSIILTALFAYALLPERPR